jgi:hypothetical protein
MVLIPQLVDETRAALACGRWLARPKKMAGFQVFSPPMFSTMATRAKRDEILEHIGPRHRMVDRQALGGTAANAAVSVPQPYRPPPVLPGEAVELGARGAGAPGRGAAGAPPPFASRQNEAAAGA